MAQLPSENTSCDLFCPPPGGDITLRSNDGVEFLVHSVVLTLASSVFQGLSVLGTNKDAIELAETAEIISLMLRFIYPNSRPPTVTCFELLLRCLQVAQKYDLESMLDTIDEQLSTNTTSGSPLLTAPFSVHQLALQFNLPRAKVAAAPLVLTEQIDFCGSDHFPERLKTYPSASAIRITAIQGARARLLADVLFRFYEPPIAAQPDQPNQFYNMSCEECQSWLKKCQRSGARQGLYTLSPPSWLLAWSTLVFDTLLAAPLDKSDHLFNAFVLDRFKGASSVCQDCLGDFWKWDHQRELFSIWARGVRDELESRLDNLRHLYAL